MRKGNFYPKGVTATGNAFQFVFRTDRPAEKIRINIYAGEKKIMNVPVSEDCRRGEMYSVVVEDVPKEADGYCYERDGEEIPDSYARGVFGMKTYGRKKGKLWYVLPKEPYDWDGDRAPLHSYGTSLIYGVHVRGFTRHVSSGIRKKGTFAGIQAKVPYLKELGVTAVELMPAYEFDEFERLQGMMQEEEKERINYWGYKEGYYYAPKSAYAYGKDAAAEMKAMVRALHRADVEVLMQFYFPDDFDIAEIPDILRFWAEEYHIDGFHLLGKRLPPSLFASDPFLKDTKLIFEHYSGDEIRWEAEHARGSSLAFWQEGFAGGMRRALKGDDGCLESMLHHLQANEEKVGIVNALAGYNGFTLMDLVSYERKHNEDNGEDNRDGTDRNDSWNCGIEGKTRKRAILTLRQKQIRNGLALLLLSQGTPYLQSGDEFGQTQDGNNNPYCQDNAVTWINWKLLQTNRTLYEYTKSLIAFRRGHGVFRQEQPLKGLDYLSCGCPDISMHGREAWRLSLDACNRHLGVMYCGKYGKTLSLEEDDSFYVVYNMHWEPHEFALPRIFRDMAWRLCMDTTSADGIDESGKEPEKEAGSMVLADGRSIQIYRAEKKKIKEEM